MGYRKLSVRPRHHAQAEGAIEAFKKTFPAALDAIAQETRSPADGRGAGPGPPRRRISATPPPGPKVTRGHIFGAVCRRNGKGAALVLPVCNSAAISLHLAEVSAMVAPAKHAVLLLDQAGWHLAGDVAVPANITLLPLPPNCPEPNVMENIWQFMRGPKATPEGRYNWLSNRIFRDHDDRVDHCCHAQNRLVAQPWRIMSIGMRDWAHRF